MTYKPDPTKEISEQTIFEWIVCIFAFPTLLMGMMILDMVGQIVR